MKYLHAVWKSALDTFSIQGILLFPETFSVQGLKVVSVRRKPFWSFEDVSKARSRQWWGWWKSNLVITINNIVIFINIIIIIINIVFNIVMPVIIIQTWSVLVPSMFFSNNPVLSWLWMYKRAHDRDGVRTDGLLIKSRNLKWWWCCVTVTCKNRWRILSESKSLKNSVLSDSSKSNLKFKRFRQILKNYLKYFKVIIFEVDKLVKEQNSKIVSARQGWRGGNTSLQTVWPGNTQEGRLFSGGYSLLAVIRGLLTKISHTTPHYYPKYEIWAIEKMVNNPFKQWRWWSLECDPTWGDDSQTIGLYGSEGWVAVGWLAFKADTFHK